MLLSAIASLFLGVRIDDAGKYVAAVLATVLCFSGLTMALSVLGNSDQAVAGAGWATLILMAMLGGAMVPLSLMPEWMVAVSDLSPVKWGIVSLEGATWRALQWAELLKPMTLLVGIGALGFAAGVAALVSWREV
jgi:linearmycin/streptolysin S transport system permease protein